MKRVRTRLGATLAAMALGASALAAVGGTAQALSNPTHPVLTLSGTISSHPWAGTSTNASDIEGLGFVPSDNSMWVGDDNADRIYEINPTTGALKSTIDASAFEAATREGVGTPSDPTRADDLESIVYDPTDDVLFVTSGNCCNVPAGQPPYNPTIYKLTRVSGHFTPTSWQPLVEGQDPTAAGWRPGTGLYYGKGSKIKTYDFATNTTGSDISLPVSPIVGIDFTDANTAFVTTATADTSLGRTTMDSDSTIHRFDISGSTWTLNSNWTFPLAGTGMIDARDTSIVGDTFYVSDGYDSRVGGDHPIYVYTLGELPTPTAAFTYTPASGVAPVSVQFTDTSTPAASSWAWDFDNNGTTDSTQQNPSHQFNTPGVYTVKLTAINIVGSTFVTHTVTVTNAPPVAWHYEIKNGSGSGVTTDKFGNGNTLLQYGTQLHGFYQDTSKSNLAHSWWDGTKWNHETLDGSGSGYAGHTSNNVGANVAAIEYGGQLQLFYTDASAHDVRHAFWDGHVWRFESLDGAGGANGRTSDNVGGGTIAVRPYGSQLQLFYSDDTTHALRHAWYDGTRWSFETLDTGLPSSTYVATTKYGTTFQVVYAASGGMLRHAWYDTAWHKETLDGPGSGYVGHTSHAVGAYARVLQFGSQLDVMYQDTTDSSLRHAWWNGTKWSFEVLDGTGGNITGHTTSGVGAHIAVLPYNGGLHVMYQDTGTGALRHAWYASGWHVEVLDGTGATYAGHYASGDTGRFTAMVQYGSQLQLTYFDHGNADRWIHSWYG